jgi:hypothetical protein
MVIGAFTLAVLVALLVRRMFTRYSSESPRSTIT